MTDKIAKTVAGLRDGLVTVPAVTDGYPVADLAATVAKMKAGADLIEALARDLAAARDRAEKAVAGQNRALDLTEHAQDRWNEAMDKRLAAEADRDRLAAELAEARDPAALAGDELVQTIIGAVVEEAAGVALDNDIPARWLRASAIRALHPDAAAAFARALQAERVKVLEEALAICTDYGLSRASECRDVIRELIAQQGAGKGGE